MPEETDRLELLKRLLLDDERRELESLRSRQERFESHSFERVSRDLPAALEEWNRRDPESFAVFAAALQPGTEEAITRSVAQNKERMTRALFPVMGSAIRDYVGAMFRSLAEDLNETIRNTTSFERIRWRIEARLAGKSFSEYLLLKTAKYRVEQLLLIDRDSGILLHHEECGSDEGNERADADADLMSGMLTAIRSFVRDSLVDPGDVESDNELNRFTYGEHQVLIEGGPEMIIAAVVEGVAPFVVREKLRDVLEKTHELSGRRRIRGAGKGDGNGGSHAESFADVLAPAFLESRGREGGGGLWRFWLFCFVVCGFLGYGSHWWWQRESHWSASIDSLMSEPGVEVISDRSWKRVRGLRDPLADDPLAIAGKMGVDSDGLELRFEPFESLHPAIVEKRGNRDVEALRSELQRTRELLSETEDSLDRTGMELDAARERIGEQEAGLAALRDRLVEERRRLLVELMRSRFGHLDSVTWLNEAGVLRVAGDAPDPEYGEIRAQARALESFDEVDVSGLVDATEKAWRGAVSALEEFKLAFRTGTLEPVNLEGDIETMAKGIESVYAVAGAAGRVPRFLVVAYPLIGERIEANRAVIAYRAEMVRDRLIEAGVEPGDLEARLAEDLEKAALGVSIVVEEKERTGEPAEGAADDSGR